MHKHNITLIGMAGVGKSTVGAVLAHKLGWQLVDIDKILEQESEKPLQSILEEVGEVQFIKLESEKVIEKSRLEKRVIAPGGSIVYSDEAMGYLKNASTIIYLEAEVLLIEKRIDTKSRGIVGLKDKTFHTLFSEREELYKKYAEYTVDVTNKSPEEIANEILSLLKL